MAGGSKAVGKDEVREFPKGKLEIAKLGDAVIGRATFQPGWKWSESVKPIAGTDSCQSHHVGYCLEGAIHVVHDGAEALDFIFATGAYSDREVENSPTLILLDIKLPKVDGLEVLKRIREDPRTCTQPVVLLTSSAERRDITTAYRYHANSYIVKPVDFDQFANAVREIGLYWMVLNRSWRSVDTRIPRSLVPGFLGTSKHHTPRS